MQSIIDTCQERFVTAVPHHARRLFHGRGQSYPGFEHVVVNWFPPFLQIALYEEMPKAWIDQLVNALVNDDVQGVVVQFRQGRRTVTETWYGNVPEEHTVLEHNLKYLIQPKRNQNVGLFLDMGHIREHLVPSMPGAKVLNLFAYTCAFSVSAIAHGAELVVNNDMNANVLKLGERNHLANDHDLRTVRMLPHNALKAWKKLRRYGPYDVLIIDPPTNQRGSFVAERDYAQVLKRLKELAKPGAQIIACLNSPFLGQDFITHQMARWAPACRHQHTFAAHPDFPEAKTDRGLKVQSFRYTP